MKRPKIFLFVGCEVGTIAHLLPILQRHETVLIQELAEMPQLEYVKNKLKTYPMNFLDMAQAFRLQSSLFNKMLTQTTMHAPRTLNQRQKRKRWKQSPNSRPCKNRK